MGILNFPFIHWWILSYSVYLLTAECLSGCVKVPYFQYQPETVTSMGLKIPVAQYTPTSDLCVHPDARAFEFWFKWSVLILKQFGFYVILRRILDAICNFFFQDVSCVRIIWVGQRGTKWFYWSFDIAIVFIF